MAGQYLTSLRTYFEQRQQASLQAAQHPGRVAVATGLEILDLAKVHHQSLVILLGRNALPATRCDLTRRGATFFTEANDKHILEITTIQLLLDESVTIINRLAYEYSSRHA